MPPVEGTRANPPPVSRAQISYSVGSSPPANLQREQLEALAELIAFRLRQGRDDHAPDERKRLVTARQAAEILAVDLKRVYRHAKELGGRKVGGAWRFDLDAGAMGDRAGSRALRKREGSTFQIAHRRGSKALRYADERPRPLPVAAGRARFQSGCFAVTPDGGRESARRLLAPSLR
jgi:hypothetical protein